MAPSTPLLDPTAYFGRRDRPSLSLAAGIVFVEAVVVSVTIWLFMQQVMARVDVEPGSAAEMRGVLVGAVFGMFVAIFAGWILLAGILHVFVWFADGERGFGTTLAVVGEAELVGVVLVPVTAFGLFSIVGQVPSDPAAAAEYFRRVASFGSPMLLLASLVGTLWKAGIQAFGLSWTHDVSDGKMLVLTFVVGIIGFLLNLA